MLHRQVVAECMVVGVINPQDSKYWTLHVEERVRARGLEPLLSLPPSPHQGVIDLGDRR